MINACVDRAIATVTDPPARALPFTTQAADQPGQDGHRQLRLRGLHHRGVRPPRDHQDEDGGLRTHTAAGTCLFSRSVLGSWGGSRSTRSIDGLKVGAGGWWTDGLIGFGEWIKAMAQYKSIHERRKKESNRSHRNARRGRRPRARSRKVSSWLLRPGGRCCGQLRRRLTTRPRMGTSSHNDRGQRKAPTCPSILFFQAHERGPSSPFLADGWGVAATLNLAACA